MKAITSDHIDVGAYALGLLEDQDKVTFDAHLARCSSCTAELAALSPVAALLVRVPPVGTGATPGGSGHGPPVHDLLRRRAAHARRGRR
jgi:anti-sigma factor RsiW